MPDHLLLVEHPPTYTLGRGGSARHLLWDEAKLRQEGIAFYRVDRGGDITYHGPNQLVGYPILNLRRLQDRYGDARPDVHLYLRQLEETVIRFLAGLGIDAWRYSGYTGIWVTTAAGPRKIAAIGVRVNARGVTSHGFAINIQPDLGHFAGIVPCGIAGHGVTSVARLLASTLPLNSLVEPLVAAFADVFNLEPAWLTAVAAPA